MHFDNPMPTFEEVDPNSPESGAGENISEDRELRIQEQLRSQVQRHLNFYSAVQGTFYAVLLFVLVLMFLEVEFDILENDRINGMIALVIVLGIAATVLKSPLEEKAPDPNYEASGYWRFVVFIFVIIGEIFLFMMVTDLIYLLSLVGLGVIVGLVGAVNISVLWQFAEEEFDDYVEPTDDKRTVVSNYGVMVFLTVLLFVVRTNLPTIQPIVNVLSLFLFLFYSGFFWTYALFDRESINVLSRIALSFLLSIFLFPVSILVLQRVGLPITTVVISITNFALCTLGFLAYNARPRFRRWLYAG